MIITIGTIFETDNFSPGTGSGSLSHYFIRAVQPHGQLHTFDFHENRAELAREEFRTHGLKDSVTV